MIAPHLSPGTHWIKADNPPPQDPPRFVVVLIAILALVNVSATVLMFGDWATMTDNMAELEQSITDHLTEMVLLRFCGERFCSYPASLSN